MDRIGPHRTNRVRPASAASRERERRTDAPHTTQEVPASGPGLDLPHPAVWSRKLHFYTKESPRSGRHAPSPV